MTLIGHWPLTEDSGDTAYDYSGEENHGTATGAGPGGTGTVAGPLGATAYDFDGTDDGISVPDSAGLHAVEEEKYSCSFWFKTTTSGAICGAYDGSYGLIIRAADLDSDGIVELDCSLLSNATSSVTTTSAVDDGEWHFGVYTQSATASSGQKVYLDGVDETVVRISNDSAQQSMTSDFNIGHRGDSASHFSGPIADVRVYDRVLTPNEVQYLYNVSQEARYVSEKKTL